MSKLKSESPWAEDKNRISIRSMAKSPNRMRNVFRAVAVSLSFPFPCSTQDQAAKIALFRHNGDVKTDEYVCVIHMHLVHRCVYVG